MLNSVDLIERVGADPEIVDYEQGELARISLATNEVWLDNGEKKERTEWHSIVLFGNLAQVVKNYVKKGDLLYVGGKIQTTSWEKDGQKRYRTEIIGRTLRMLSGKKESSKPPANVYDVPNKETDELPF